MEELAARRKRVQIVYMIHTILYGAALGLALLKQYPPSFIIGGANMILYFLYVRGQVKGYSDAVARANVVHGLCEPLESARFTDRKGLTLESFEAMELLPIRAVKGSLLVREGFEGEGFGLTLRGWEMTLHYPVTFGGKTNYKFLSGTVLTAEGASAPWESDWLLLRREMLDRTAQAEFLSRRGYVRAECPLEGLDADFLAYGRAEGARIPRETAQRLLKCFQKAASLGAVHLSPKGAAVYLGNRFYTGRTKVRDLPTEEQLRRNHLPERDGVWELFRYWAAAGKTK